MSQELKRHHINELSAMIKLKGGIGYPIVYYANEVDAVVAKKDVKIGKLTDKLSKTGGQIKRLADCAHVLNIELARKEKLIAEKDAENRRLQRALWLARAERYKTREFIAREEANWHDLMAWSQFIRKRTYNQWVDQLLRIAHLANKLHNKCRAKAEEYK